MPTLPPARQQGAFPGADNLTIHRGKVRDMLSVPDHPDSIVQIASNGISIFDFVLNALVSHKGEVLTALTIFWGRMFQTYGIPTHLEDDQSRLLQGIPEEILPRAIAVQRLDMFPIEFIARWYLTGSGLASYQRHGHVCGHLLPKGLADGDRLPYLLDTPTTKAEEGHDEHVDAKEVSKRYPDATLLLLRIFSIMHDHARSRGIILADTKLEFGVKGNRVILADEFGTPDSSRYWSAKEWGELQRKRTGKAPTSLDKELVRKWGKGVQTPFGVTGIHNLDPKNPDHLAFVHSLEVPAEVIATASQTYRYIFWLLTGKKLELFQREDMGIKVALPQPRVEVILGSRSDMDQATPGIMRLRNALPESHVHVHVASCHRNLRELVRYTHEVDCDVIITGAGKAAALPGMIDTLLREENKRIPVIGVGFGKEGTKSFEAAQLSIEEVPGDPIVTREDGSAYMGPKGFEAACLRVTEGELPPWKSRETKPAEWNLPRGA